MEEELERYMRRNPCVLDRLKGFSDRHPSLTHGGVSAVYAVLCVLYWRMAAETAASPPHAALMFAGVALSAVLYAGLASGSPGVVRAEPDRQHEAAGAKLGSGAAPGHSYCERCPCWRP